jgi:hypothetical protein
MLRGEKMTNETTNEICTIEASPQALECAPKPKIKSKRDIFRFAGEKPTAINLEHVTQMGVEGKRITFQFYSTAMFIDLADEASALSVFEVLLNVWAGEAQ